ncbi:MAG: WD40 repeat domain-containing protein [Planctomycetota bacterium]|nr:WD40 repeat domain-containing protein [Planctomycetota bacterium]
MALRVLPLAFAIVACDATATHLLAQQPPTPNPFRTTQTSSRNDAQVAISESRYADVIQLDKLPSHSEPPVITALSVSPSGELIAAAGDDHAIRIVALKTGKTVSTLSGHLDWVQCVEFSPNGKRLASCGHDGTLRIWSIDETPKVLFEKSVGHALFSLAFLNDDQIYAVGFSNKIYHWNAIAGEMVVDHACECRDVRAIACSPDGALVAYGGRDGVLRIRHVNDSNDSLSSQTSKPQTSKPSESKTIEWKAPLHFDRIRSIQFSQDGRQITSVGEDRRIVHYDVLKRTAVGQTEVGGGKLMGLCQLETNLFAIAGSDNSIRIFSDIDRRVLVKLVGHDGSVGVLKRTSKLIISGSFDTTIRLWDIDRAISSSDTQGRYVHPIAAQFEDSGAGDLVK